MTTRLPGFYLLDVADRRRRIADLCDFPTERFDALDPGALTIETADGMIENVIGTYGLPFAVAVNFTLDGEDRLVPMAIEEPSVVAAASNAARLTRPSGFHAEMSPPVMIGQIQVTHIADVEHGAAALRAAADEILDEARALLPRLAERGGGPRGLEVRVLAPSGIDGGVLVAHLHVDCRDAMGANMLNTLCEALAERVAAIAGGRPGLRILSNLTDGRIATVRCRIDGSALPADERAGIAAASRFAELDPYRAATHNKGIMNGVDAVLVATGQDWRAVEAGAHAYAARSGTYRPLAVWREDGADLIGELAMPLAVGTVGGVLHAHPSANFALELAGVSSGGQADRLAALAAAAGLASNLAALRARDRGHPARPHGAARAKARSSKKLIELYRLPKRIARVNVTHLAPNTRVSVHRHRGN